MMDNTEETQKPKKSKTVQKKSRVPTTLIGVIKNLWNWWVYFTSHTHPYILIALFFLVLLLEFIGAFVYARLSLNSSTPYPASSFVALVILAIVYIGIYYRINKPSGSYSPFFLKIVGTIIILAVTIITAQVAFTPMIAPRISFDRSTTSIQGHIIGQTQYVGQMMYFTIKPPLYPIFPCVDVKLAYSRLVLGLNPRDLNPLITLYYTSDKSGNPTTAKICTNRIDGWNVEDIKSSIFVEKEQVINLSYYVIVSSFLLPEEKKINRFNNTRGMEFEINLSNNDIIPIHIENYTIQISNDSYYTEYTWRNLLHFTEEYSNGSECISFYSVNINQWVGGSRRYPREIEINNLPIEIFKKEGITILPVNLEQVYLRPSESIASYVQAYLVDCPTNVTVPPL